MEARMRLAKTTLSLALIFLGGFSAPRHRPTSEGSQDFPAILIEPVGGIPAIADDSSPAKFYFHLVILQYIVDTTGHPEPGTIHVLHASDSAAARAVRTLVPTLRYVPARMVEVAGPCVRFNDGPRTCGGPQPSVRPVRHQVELKVKYEQEP
jgi:hypothetical protein